MNRRKLLQCLCQRYHLRCADNDSGERLLRALGVPTTSNRLMKKFLNAQYRLDFKQMLPPVQVVGEEAGVLHLPLSLCRRWKHRPLRWTLFFEDGGSSHGVFRTDQLGSNEQHQPCCAPRQGDTSYILTLPQLPVVGYHRLVVYENATAAPAVASMVIIVAPRQCYQPAAVRDSGRVWGLAIQLPTIRSARNWGSGDFTDLRRIIEIAAEFGAGLVSLNPLHACLQTPDGYASALCPSSPLFLDSIYLDIEAMADFADCMTARQLVAEEHFQAQLRALRATELVDFAAVVELKRTVLASLYDHFQHNHLANDSPRAREFNQFRAEQGEELQRFALFEALQTWLFPNSAERCGWTQWPQEYRTPTAAAVASFRESHREQIEFYEYLHWQAQVQLEAVGQRAYALGLQIGLCPTLADAVAGDGAQSWGHQDYYLQAATIAVAPQTATAPQQNFNIPACPPQIMRQQGYALFIAALRNNMRSAGALTIHSIDRLRRQYWAATAEPGAPAGLVEYPFDDLLAIIALESQRNRCMVIGEESAVTTNATTTALTARGVYRCRCFLMEKAADQHFCAPQSFAPQSLLRLSAWHQPTLAGYWQGLDLDVSNNLGLFADTQQRERQIVARAEERTLLLLALEQQALLPTKLNTRQLLTTDMTLELALATHRYLARSPAKIMAVALEDLLPERSPLQSAAPKSVQKVSLELELWENDARIQSFVQTLRAERGTTVSTVEPVTAPAIPLPQTDIPTSTYRLQLSHNFTFDQAAAIVPYLKKLGISHCYISPFLQARAGSSHGYDIVDHTAINPELGGAEAFERFSAALHHHQMGLILDIVPNHMGVMGADNRWWLDVLENGRASPYADFFDIDWFPLRHTLHDKVLIAVLGDHYGSVLEQGELQLCWHRQRGSFSIHYFEHEFPVDPHHYPRILADNIASLVKRLGADNPRLLEFQSLVTAFGNLPQRHQTDCAAINERERDKELHKASLSRMADDSDIAHFIDENLRRFNSKAGIEQLHELLEDQAWRLAYWGVASDEINYRRFFDINDLAGLRMENPAVFTATHQLVLRLIGEGKVQGLRIDHPDGLCDPATYFQRLQHAVGASARNRKPLYLLVEKILADHEQLCRHWLVHGTTGYDFANQVSNVLIDADAAGKMAKIYAQFVDHPPGLDEQIHACKKLIMSTALASELNVLAQQLSRIAELDRHTCDFTVNSLREALSEIIAAFAVYRTYIQATVTRRQDRQSIALAVNSAKRKGHAAANSIFDFVQQVLLLDISHGKDDHYRHLVINFALKFQQYSAPVMAKGLEDTAFYRYNRLISLNEVGGNPQRFGGSSTAFHLRNRKRNQHWPHAMLSSSTHDSKRSEDVRTRINVLSELPQHWQRRVQRWSKLNQKHKTRMSDGTLAPSKNDEYFIYQTLLGVWPLATLEASAGAELGARLHPYLTKCVKEAKVHSAWINPDLRYEQAVADFILAVIDTAPGNPFMKSFLPFQRRLSRAGQFNSLSQTLLKLTSPGVPDFYQGNELWNYCLVDPDNRRPVDFNYRNTLLSALENTLATGKSLATFCNELVENIDDSRAKLYLIWKTLHFRNENPQLFHHGKYLALKTSGKHAPYLCAFARRHCRKLAVTAVPRLTTHLSDGAAPLGEPAWHETRLTVPGRHWYNVLSGETLHAERIDNTWQLHAADILHCFPVALLHRQP